MLVIFPGIRYNGRQCGYEFLLGIRMIRSLQNMKKSTAAKWVLFLTAVLWGSTFSIGKLAAEVFSASFIIALRFLVAGIVLLIAAFPQRRQLDRKYWIDGCWMGVTLFASYMLQVGGLTLDTSPGKSAFLCTT